MSYSPHSLGISSPNCSEKHLHRSFKTIEGDIPKSVEIEFSLHLYEFRLLEYKAPSRKGPVYSAEYVGTAEGESAENELIPGKTYAIKFTMEERDMSKFYTRRFNMVKSVKSAARHYMMGQVKNLKTYVNNRWFATVMDYYPWSVTTYFYKLRKEKLTLNESQFSELVENMIKTLEDFHTLGNGKENVLLHLDVKPCNFLMDNGGELKLTDFCETMELITREISGGAKGSPLFCCRYEHMRYRNSLQLLPRNLLCDYESLFYSLLYIVMGVTWTTNETMDILYTKKTELLNTLSTVDRFPVSIICAIKDPRKNVNTKDVPILASKLVEMSQIIYNWGPDLENHAEKDQVKEIRNIWQM